MYAIIEDSGTQIRVAKGDVIKVALRPLEGGGSEIVFDKVLLVSDPEKEGSTRVGQPYVEGARVRGDVLGQEKTKKVRIVKFKRRKNVLRRKGHRQPYLKVRITAIEV